METGPPPCLAGAHDAELSRDGTSAMKARERTHLACSFVRGAHDAELPRDGTSAMKAWERTRPACSFIRKTSTLEACASRASPERSADAIHRCTRNRGLSGLSLLEGSGLHFDYVCGLQSLGSLDHVELNRLAFFKRAKAGGLNGGVMDEDISA